MATPFLSIIIPALNEEHFLPKLLESLTTQTDKNFEVIVVDGKSKDKTVEAAKQFEKRLPKFSVVVADHASLPYQRNYGAHIAKSQWFVFLDSDDIVYPYTVSRIHAYIDSHNPPFFTAWCSPDSEVYGDALFTLLTNMFYAASNMLKRPIAPGPFTGVRRDIFERVGGYDENHPFLEDQDLSQRIAKLGFLPDIIRETLFVLSLRRYRKQGTLKVLQAYAKAVVPIFIFKQTPKNMTGYVMGGHVFDTKSKVKPSALKRFSKTLKHLVKEVFE